MNEISKTSNNDLCGMASPEFPPKSAICSNFDLVEIVFICVAFTFLLILLAQACRIMSSGFMNIVQTFVPLAGGVKSPCIWVSFIMSSFNTEHANCYLKISMQGRGSCCSTSSNCPGYQPEPPPALPREPCCNPYSCKSVCESTVYAACVVVALTLLVLMLSQACKLLCGRRRPSRSRRSC